MQRRSLHHGVAVVLLVGLACTGIWLAWAGSGQTQSATEGARRGYYFGVLTTRADGVGSAGVASDSRFDTAAAAEQEAHRLYPGAAVVVVEADNSAEASSMILGQFLAAQPAGQPLGGPVPGSSTEPPAGAPPAATPAPPPGQR